MYIPLEPDEKVILKVHKHWWFVLVQVVGFVVFLLLLPVAKLIFLQKLSLFAFEGTARGVPVAILALWILVDWVMFWQFWTLYYMDMWIVTNKRLIDIDYKAFFDRNIAMLRLNKVQDVTVQVRGVFGSLLKYGTILVQTAGSDKEFYIDRIGNPEELRDTISRLAGEASGK